jgi:methylamine dehydrogenase accessory protein MauD
MEGPWLTVYIIQWIVIVALALVVLSHSRLIGQIYQRIGPVAARSLPDEFPLGAQLKEVFGTDLAGQPWRRTFPSEKGLLAIFVSPQCQACNNLVPHARDFVSSHTAGPDIVLLSVLADMTMNRAYVRFAKLDGLSYFIAHELADKFAVPATPYAVTFDGAGRILAKGVVNNYEHLASLPRSAEHWGGPSPK